jgi:hypothetical protein
MDIDPGVMRVARAVTRDVMGAGALAVVMTGSHVRGEPHPYSDIDLIAIVRKRLPPGERVGALRPYRMRGGHLVALAWETRASTLATFRDPELALTFVPGWRQAIVLADTDGVAAKLKRAAEHWTWDSIADKCDQHVAVSITGLAEEVHKLAGMLAEGNMHTAAAQRSILAVWLAGIVAVRRRILFGTDNALWDLVAAEMGPPWRRAQSAALSENGESLKASCRAALQLYALAAADAWTLLSPHQRQVVAAACAIATGKRAAGRGSRGSR